MSVKKDLLAEIDKRVKKRQDKKVEAANNKSLETAVFEFFRNIEESRQIHNGNKYDAVLFSQAQAALQERVRGFDRGTKVSIEFNVNPDPQSWTEETVRGVTIWWSRAYIAKHNVDPTLYIDVSSMLFW